MKIQNEKEPFNQLYDGICFWTSDHISNNLRVKILSLTWDMVVTPFEDSIVDKIKKVLREIR